MSRYQTYYNGKVFVFEGEGIKAQDANVHALMQKIKRLKIGVEPVKDDNGQKRKRAHTA